MALYKSTIIDINTDIIIIIIIIIIWPASTQSWALTIEATKSK